MKVPWEVGRVLTPEEWETYCRQVISDCRHCGIRAAAYREMLLDFALLMRPGEWPALARLAEKLTTEVLAAEQELHSRPDLYELLGLPANISKVLQMCRPEDRPKGPVRIMRFDFYFTGEGWLFSEANPDVPGGQIGASGFTDAMASYYSGYSPPPNSASIYAEAILKAVGNEAVVGILHEGGWTTMPEAHFIRKEIEKHGMRGVMLTPPHLQWRSGFARILRSGRTEAPSLLVRRLPSVRLPNQLRSSLWVPWFCGGQTPMSNPGFSILTESKRFPLVWKELDAPMRVSRAHSPVSRSPIDVRQTSQEEWVFKPAFGWSGHGIAIAGVSKKQDFKRIADRARRHPTKWVAQGRFESIAVPTERGPGHVCMGIYTVNGVAAGAFGRIRGKALIDQRALFIPVLIPHIDIGPRRDFGSRPDDEKLNKS